MGLSLRAGILSGRCQIIVGMFEFNASRLLLAAAKRVFTEEVPKRELQEWP